MLSSAGLSQPDEVDSVGLSINRTFTKLIEVMIVVSIFTNTHMTGEFLNLP